MLDEKTRVVCVRVQGRQWVAQCVWSSACERSICVCVPLTAGGSSTRLRKTRRPTDLVVSSVAEHRSSTEHRSSLINAMRNAMWNAHTQHCKTDHEDMPACTENEAQATSVVTHVQPGFQSLA
jgi:hypothetical protein